MASYKLGGMLVGCGMVALVVVLALGVWVVGIYNSVIRLDRDVDNAWAQVDNQYQRRFDLFANLQVSGGAALAQERAIFEDITDARAAYGNAGSEDAKAQLASEQESLLSSSLSRLLVIVEDNPEITTQETMRGIMDELTGTQNRVAVERMRYNDKVTEFNKKIVVFPTNIVANMLGFEERTLFEAAGGTDVNPDLDFGVE